MAFGDSNHIFELEIEGGVKTKDIFLFLIYWCQKLIKLYEN